MSLTKTPTALLLDWDDHLIDSRKYYTFLSEISIRHMVDELRYPEPKTLFRDRGAMRMTEYFIEHFGEEGAAILMSHREKMLLDANLTPPELKPGARELLTFLELNNIPYAIFSDTIQPRLENNVSRSLGKLGLPIPLLVGTIKGQVEKKPNPAGIFKALELLSKKHGFEIKTDASVIFSGDIPEKDGLAAIKAGITPVIIPNGHNTGNHDYISFDDLESLVKTLARTVGKDFIRPRYVKRLPYTETREQTLIITGDKDFIESPMLDAVDGNVYTPEEQHLHNLRWIAKKAKNLDGTGNYDRQGQFEAAFEVIQKLLTPSMVEELTKRTVDAVKARRANGHPADSEIVIHLPHRVVNPPKPIENMLSVAYNHELAKILNKIFADKYPELNVRFDSTDRLLSSLSIRKTEEQAYGTENIQIEGLTGHKPETTVTLGRAVGTHLDRLVKQPIFDYSTFQKGDLVIITDDHVQGGGTFVTWFHALKSLGVEQIAYTTLSTMPESKNLQPHEDVVKDMKTAIDYSVQIYLNEFPNADREAITEKFTRKIETTLAKLGLSIETLANREALTVMAYIIDGTQQEQLAWFKKTADKYGADLTIVERKDESLIIQASEPAITPIEFGNKIDSITPKYTVKQL